MTAPTKKRRQPTRMPKSPRARASFLRLNQPSRPALRWHGGKWLLAPWILDYLPEHETYVEPYGGAASVLLRKERCYAEVYNDLDDDVHNYFRVLRDPDMSRRLIETVALTPYSRREFERSYLESDDPVERARRLAVLSFMGFGSNAHCKRTTAFRALARPNGSTPAQDWARLPEGLAEIVDRLKGVVIEHRNAFDVMAQHDSPSTLHYVDPPYVYDSRSIQSRSDRRYNHELTDDDHRRLLRFLKDLRGMVVLSGYPHPIYDDALPTWRRVTTEAHADGAAARTEVLWINPAASAALDAMHADGQLAMFEGPHALAAT